LTHRSAVSEQSYLPFLFHAEDKEPPSFKGRRSFVHGKEVIPVCALSPFFTLLRRVAIIATNPRLFFLHSMVAHPFAATRAGAIV
jgi:hypothetical protein